MKALIQKEARLKITCGVVTLKKKPQKTFKNINIFKIQVQNIKLKYHLDASFVALGFVHWLQS